ncbi:2-oxoglutarate and oxygenase superfamily protein [Perilla frutescens var. hirtella]|nr:2-oxoglutarate and oxygenase superfamily protein [Perilla frutescens var. hirtella]
MPDFYLSLGVGRHKERKIFSTPHFMNLAHDAMVEPLEELVDKQNPAKYKAYSWEKFLSNRKRINFKKLDVEENVQIYHFKN